MATKLNPRYEGNPPRFAGLIVVIFLVLMYLTTLTSDYYWDGITFALQVEKVAGMERSRSLLFHQNHLFYNALGYAAYELIRALSFSARALYVLQDYQRLCRRGRHRSLL